MREYVVQPGDSPALIAIAHAGCPKCAVDLVRANPHKPSVVYPNGFATFQELVPGERLTLPEKWFNGALDARPKAYFAALPYADGKTPSTLGDAAAGVLADYAALDAASAKVGALAAMNDQDFAASVEITASAIDSSVREVTGDTAPGTYAAPFVQEVHFDTAKARARNASLFAAIQAGDQSTAFQVRTDILHDFSDALLAAGLAMQAYYGDAGEQPPLAQAASSAVLASAAQATVAAIQSDPSYCVSVAHPGSAVNVAVHAFKAAWNATQSPALPINTGAYEQATAGAVARVLGSAPAACSGIVPSPGPTPSPTPVATAPQKSALSAGQIAGIGLLGAAVLGGAAYLVPQKPVRGRRRARRRR